MRYLAEQSGTAVLLKGGHGDAGEAVDVLEIWESGKCRSQSGAVQVTPLTSLLTIGGLTTASPTLTVLQGLTSDTQIYDDTTGIASFWVYAAIVDQSVHVDFVGMS